MIYRSPYPDLAIPNLPFSTFALQQANRLPGKPALIDAMTGRSVTFCELRGSVERATAGLSEHGVQQHDVVALFAPNSIEYVIAFHAIATLGATVSTISPLFKEQELERQLEEHNARFIITVPDLIGLVSTATRNRPLRDVFVIGESTRHTSFAVLLASGQKLPSVEIDPGNDIVALLSSSGTTGMPKGVMLTHRALVSMGLQAGAPHEMCEDDVIPGTLPLFHAYAVMITLSAALSVGATSVILPRFDFEQFLRLIQDYRISRVYAVPPILIGLAKQPVVENYDLGSLRAIISAAAPLGADIERAVRDRVGCVVKQLHGLTECVPVFVSPDGIPTSKQGSVGVVAPNTEVRIIDAETGEDCVPGQPGEVLVRGLQMMTGYLENPSATAASIDREGWLHTGDLAHVDEDGYFYIVDRLKELIKYKGYQVAPAELEAVLLTHPAVADAAVVRFPDEDSGEVPKAFVVARTPVDAEELMDWVAERVAPYKKVRRVEFIDQIPRSPSGKILRRMLTERDRDTGVSTAFLTNGVRRDEPGAIARRELSDAVRAQAWSPDATGTGG